MKRNVVQYLPNTSLVRSQYDRQVINNLEVVNNIESIDFREYWSVVKRDFKSIIVLTLLIGIISALASFVIQPKFISTVKLLVEPEVPSIVSLDPLQNATNTLYFYETQYELIKSRSVAEEVINNLDLRNNPHIISELPVLEESDANVSENDKRAALFNYFSEHLIVKGEKNSQIIKVSYETIDPVLAAEISNAVAQAYIDKGMESRLAVSRQASRWLTERLSDLREKLERSENLLRKYQEKEALIDLKSYQDVFSRKLSDITEELVKAQSVRATAETNYRQVKEAEKSGKGFESLQAVLKHPLIQKLKEEQAKLGRVVTELSEIYGEKHPKMINAVIALSEADRRLDLEIRKVVDGIENEYMASIENVRRLNEIHKELQENMRDQKSKEFELAKYERDVEANRHLYNMFMTRFKETDLTDDILVTNIQVVDRAEPPIEPSKPKKKMIVIVSMLSGFLIAVLFAFIKDYLDNTFKTPEQIEEKLNMPVLGVVPYVDVEDITIERYSWSNRQTSFAESIGNIRTGILFSNIDNPPKTLLVTSSLASEGKTTFANNLALSFSDMGKTLLIEGDLRKPRQSRIYNIEKQVGLSELVSGEFSIDDCVVQDAESEGLYILHAGKIPPKPLELLSSRKFSELLKELRGRYEYLVIDCAPILPVSDAQVLSQEVDGTIFVIKADDTNHAHAMQAVKKLRMVGIEPLGSVLTQSDEKKLQAYNGYSYQGYYGEAEIAKFNT